MTDGYSRKEDLVLWMKEGQQDNYKREIMSERNLGTNSDYNAITTYLSILNNEEHCGISRIYEPLKVYQSQTMAKMMSKDGRVATTVKRQQRQRWIGSFTKAALLSLIASTPLAMAECVSLSGSTQCPAFTSASIDTTMTGLLYVLTSP